MREAGLLEKEVNDANAAAVAIRLDLFKDGIRAAHESEAGGAAHDVAAGAAGEDVAVVRGLAGPRRLYHLRHG